MPEEEYDLAAKEASVAIFSVPYSKLWTCPMPTLLHSLQPTKGQHVLHSTQQMKKPKPGSWGPIGATEPGPQIPAQILAQHADLPALITILCFLRIFLPPHQVLDLIKLAEPHCNHPGHAVRTEPSECSSSL